MARDFVWAVDEDGKPCKCYAKPENRGKRNCKHRAHQEPGQSSKEFFEQNNLNYSIFKEDEIKVVPYRMTEEEKAGLLKIERKKDLFAPCDDGAYLELDEPLWNDMDKNAFAQMMAEKGDKSKNVKYINSVLHEEEYIYIRDCDGHKLGDIVTDIKNEGGAINPVELEDKIQSGAPIGTGVVAMNMVSENNGFEATKDVYVLPYYMRRGVPTPEGDEIPSDLTEKYKLLFTKQAYSYKSRQTAYEELISNGGSGKKAKEVISDRFAGKRGVWRKHVTAATIPYMGRAVIRPCKETTRYDEAELPPAIASDIFKPTVIKYMQDKGFSTAQIKEVIKDSKGRQGQVSPITKKILQDAMTQGNVRVILNRQPSLHEGSMQSFKPLISDSATIGINPLVCQNFGADFDGDTVACIGVSDSNIIEDVDSELSPDNFKQTPRAQSELAMQPTKDAKFGIFSVLRARSN